MANVKPSDEEALEFPDKRNLDLPTSDSNKKPKLETLTEKNAPEETQTLAPPPSQLVEDDHDDDDEEDYNADEEEETPVIDRKGKGIMKDDKGKGKMVIEESDDDEDDSDEDSGSSDDSDSDFDDGLDDVSDIDEDPLAEVDLDNILPSRTRRSRGQPGLRIAGGDSDKGNDA